MSGRIDALNGDLVTIAGQTYQFPETLRWILELSARDGCEVEVFVVGGVVRSATRVPR